MRRWLSGLALAATCLAVLSPPGETVVARPAESATVYTCPMHPEVTDDKPSRCPKCKMKLVPK